MMTKLLQAIVGQSQQSQFILFQLWVERGSSVATRNEMKCGEARATGWSVDRWLHGCSVHLILWSFWFRWMSLIDGRDRCADLNGILRFSFDRFVCRMRIAVALVCCNCFCRSCSPLLRLTQYIRVNSPAAIARFDGFDFPICCRLFRIRILPDLWSRWFTGWFLK